MTNLKLEALKDESGQLVELIRYENGKKKRLFGRKALEEEKIFAQKILTSPDACLPILIGSGLGAAADSLARNGRLFVVLDREWDILAETKVWAKLKDNPNVLWLNESDLEILLNEIFHLVSEHGFDGLSILAHPAYKRLDRDYYGRAAIILENPQEALTTMTKPSASKYLSGDDDITKSRPCLILPETKLFLFGEAKAALERLRVEYSLLIVPEGLSDPSDYLKLIRQAIRKSRPNFFFTFNHLGVDREGFLQSELLAAGLPLASWFVDNPELLLPIYTFADRSGTVIFSWDADSLEAIKKMGYPEAHFLPLAVDEKRFIPRPEIKSELDVAFVGNSMFIKTLKRLEAAAPPPVLLNKLPLLAAAFSETSGRSVPDFLKKEFPDCFALYLTIPDGERRLAFETALIWKATGLYRQQCLSKLMPFVPTIVGDPGWLQVFSDEGQKWHKLPELAYYDQLPCFYPKVKISFNCTSKQMKGALNQRIFDVPACGGFLLTDRQSQLELVFDSKHRLVTYGDPEEIPELCRFYLSHARERQRLAKAAGEHVRKEHTYVQRLRSLLRIMSRFKW